MNRRYWVFALVFALTFTAGIASAFIISEYVSDSPFSVMSDVAQLTHHYYSNSVTEEEYREFLVDVNFKNGLIASWSC